MCAILVRVVRNAALYIVEAVYIYVVLSMYSVADIEGVLFGFN